MKAISKDTLPSSTGLFIGDTEIVAGIRLTSETIHFEMDGDIAKSSGKYLTVEYSQKLAAFSVRHSQSRRVKLLAEFLMGWEIFVFDILPLQNENSRKEK